VFKPQEMNAVIKIKIVPKDESVERDESFGIVLKSVTPEGAKLSKKNMQIVNIITDTEKKKKEEMYTQLLAQIEEEEEITWSGQFVKAIKLHPAKNDEGDIVDIEPMDALVHFISIGWKVIFCIVPPPHYGGGWPCFFIALAMIGIVTYVIQMAAELFGCVLGLEPSITAVTVVALGTSLPDTFASMIAANQDNYADAAIGNVTGSNSVNVFLGLGLPWVIALLYL